MTAPLLALLAAVAGSPADTLLRSPSPVGVAQTVTRLAAAATAQGMTIFATVDHAANAAGVGMTLPPTTVVIVGNPRAGTLLMQCAPAVAVDLPLRILVWEDAEGRTWVGHQDPQELLARYGLGGCRAIVERISGVLATLRREATAPRGGGEG